MSYCVNCGVELDKSLQACPLCNTPVINPRELEQKMGKSSFPKEKGQVETVKRKDLGLLLSVVLIAAGVTCGILNLFVFAGSAWSLLIIGACLIVWVLFIPIVIYTKLSAYSALLFDGIAIGVYLYLITLVTGNDTWFFELALPIVLLVFCIAELFTLCLKKLPVTFLTTTLYLFSAAGILCVGLDVTASAAACRFDGYQRFGGGHGAYRHGAQRDRLRRVRGYRRTPRRLGAHFGDFRPLY